ncbi:TetR/AcrR family transcriptional regulator [Gordonia jinhuaensis]|uniref:TetR family transcriptional regulator n=1 Tax=Gordonia jinhuaensis TaxID=1517702 RepID=A0A916TAD2_9ACTN|nr:TetR/AcrR family transcriptional regulator [Gordonia jinhuaensis]GGB37766.1 TetR family transcriptional regulator [Gordonia jinhuaensis]
MHKGSASEPSTSGQKSARGRGRPRSEQARTAILAATAEVLADSEPGAVTIEAIATRAGVSKTTIYKWWPTRVELILDSLATTTHQTRQITPGLSTHDALVEHLQRLIDLLSDPATGGHVVALTAEALRSPSAAAALAEKWIGPRRETGAQIMRDGIARGDLRSDLDIDLALDELFAPSYYRATYRYAAVDDHSATEQVDAFLRGAAAPAPGTRSDTDVET